MLSGIADAERRERLLNLICASLMELFWKAAGVFLVFGCVDLFRQLQEPQIGTAHEQAGDPRRDEGHGRQSADEGADPPPAARPRAQQMMKEVPTATAVIVNPTHLRGGHPLPHGQHGRAAWSWPRARTTWRCASARRRSEHQVPIIENPPLAQALYKSVEVGQEIPPHLYRAVAEILAYIFKLMNGRMPG